MAAGLHKDVHLALEALNNSAAQLAEPNGAILEILADYYKAGLDPDDDVSFHVSARTPALHMKHTRM